MAGNMPKEEAMLNYVEELQKVYSVLVCVQQRKRFVLCTDCRDDATIQGG